MNNIKNIVKEKIKEYSNEKYLNNYIENEFLTKNGDAIIFLKINNIDSLFDSRTTENQLDIDNSIYEYIDNKASLLNNDIKLRLNIIGTNIKDEDKEKIKSIINEHYAIELYKAQKEYKYHKSRVYKLLIIGIIFLICYAIIALTFSSKFFIEIFGFLFSFALWQVFEILIYTLNDIQFERENITQKLVMDIIFEEKGN